MEHLVNLRTVILFHSSNFTDETSQREAFEDLLSRLVTTTESCSVVSLEKTYFTVNNMIYKNRKNLDKTILIKVSLNIVCFINSLPFYGNTKIISYCTHSCTQKIIVPEGLSVLTTAEAAHHKRSVYGLLDVLFPQY